MVIWGDILLERSNRTLANLKHTKFDFLVDCSYIWLLIYLRRIAVKDLCRPVLWKYQYVKYQK